MRRSLRNLLVAVTLVLGFMAPGTARAELLSDDSLDRVLAPVALYPDSLLGNVLLAATYPAQVLAANQWAQSNPGRSLQQVANAVSDSGWDPSVQALVLTPEVLAMMVGDMGWTADLGQAFTDQTSDVYDSIQRLRKRALANGHLVSNESVNVVTDQLGYVSIGSRDPSVLVVPRYTPAVVYGWDPGQVVLETALVWGTVYLLDRVFYGTCWDWHQRRFWWGPGYGACGYWNGGFRPWGYGYNWSPVRAHLVGRPPSWQVGMRPPGGDRHGHRPPPPPGGDRPGYGSGPRPGDYPGYGSGPRPGDRPGYGSGPRPGGDRPGYGSGPRPGGDRPGYGSGSRPGSDRPGYGSGTRPGGDRPGYGSGSPATSTSHPMMGTPRPGLSDPSGPGYGSGPRPGGDRPGYGSGTRPGSDRPGYGGSLPSTSTSRPNMGTPRPGLSDPSRPGGDRPSYGSGIRPGGDRPSYGTGPRSGNTSRPSMGTSRPGMGTSRPGPGDGRPRGRERVGR